MTDRSHYFRVKPRHCAANQSRGARNFRIRRFRLVPTETDKAIPFLAELRNGERLVKFFRDRRGNRAATNWNSARKNPLGLDEEQIRRARAYVDEQCAACEICIIV